MPVGGLGVGGELERLLEVVVDGGLVGFGGDEAVLDEGELFADAVLFLFEEVEGDRFGVVGVQHSADVPWLGVTLGRQAPPKNPETVAAMKFT